MKQLLSKSKNKLLDTIFPQCCPVCGDIVVPKGRYICSECKHSLPYINGPQCMRCGQPIAAEQAEYCEVCAEKSRAFERGVAVFNYNELMRRMIGDFKFRSHREYSHFFAEELAERFKMVYEGLGIQAFVPVPVHSSKKRYRGYNQSELLCNELAEILDIPVYNPLVRTKKTLPQKELKPAERRKNLSDAMCFAEPEEYVKAGYKPETVVLVDDIYTTGATAEACSDMLKQNGIKQVYLLNIAIGNKIN